MPVIKKLNLPKYSEEIAKIVVAAVATDVWNNARSTVTKDTGNLRGSIFVQKLNSKSWEVGSGAEYALAQEYGRPDLTGYNFEPYMRPAAKFVFARIPMIVKKAELAARAKARI